MLTIQQFVKRLETVDKSLYKRHMQFFMNEFGTSLPCNRFAQGNLNEDLIAKDVISQCGLEYEVLTNEKRVDLSVKDFGKFSVKYSSSGAIKLHNSNGVTNKDMAMANTLLVTPTEWWYLDTEEIEKNGTDLKVYLKNSGDGLTLQRSILGELKKKEYPHWFLYDLEIKRTECKNRKIGDIVYEYILRNTQPIEHALLEY